MNVFSKVAVIAGLVWWTTFAVANTTAVNQQALAPTQITTVKQALTQMRLQLLQRKYPERQ